MKILPAIDIKEGKCVRLAKGDYSQVTHYFDNPLDVAKKWIDQGSMNLHIVDLDGAKSGETINYDIIAKIRNNHPDIYIQIGGGIRDVENINKYRRSLVRQQIYLDSATPISKGTRRLS